MCADLDKIQSFLAHEVAREGHQRCCRIDLCSANLQLGTWLPFDETFEKCATEFRAFRGLNAKKFEGVDSLVDEIVAIVDGLRVGTRCIVRTTQYFGGRASLSFAT